MAFRNADNRLIALVVAGQIIVTAVILGILLWESKRDTGSTAADGLVYLNDRSELFAADAWNGKIWWNVKIGGPLMVTPVVADGSVCFAYGSAGTLYALPLSEPAPGQP